MKGRIAESRFDNGAGRDLSAHTVASENLHVIVAITFDRQALPADISAFKTALINCPLVLHSVEVSGSFDFMIEAVFSDMCAYNDQLQSMTGRWEALVARRETSFVGRRFVRAQRPDRAIWVPLDSGLRRIDCSNVDKVTAQGDYMLVQSAGAVWMMHSTLRSIVERFPAEDFAQINRSTVVRYGFIERLLREGRHWLVLLDDGSREPISKGRVVEILRALRAPTAKRGSGSSKGDRLVEAHPVS